MCERIPLMNRPAGLRTLGVGLALLWAATGARAQSEPKLPVPDAAAQKNAEKLLQEIFKDDYAKRSPADKTALAAKMMAQARDVKDDAVSRFVLYREAQSLYTAGGDGDAALTAIDELSKLYAVDGVALKSAVFASLTKAAKTPEDWTKLTNAQIRFAMDAAMAEQYDAADKAIQNATAAAKKSGSVPLASSALAKAKEIADLRARSERIKKARETLATRPDDPAANEAIGMVEVTGKEGWNAALPLLAKAANAGLRTAAQADLATPKEAAQQVLVGDGWWDLADKETGAIREAFRLRALQWYDRSFRKLTGLSRMKVDKRLAEYPQARLVLGTWVDVSDGRLYGKPPGPLELAESAHATLEKMPAGKFDGLSVHARGTGEQFKFSVQYEPRKHDMEISTFTEKFGPGSLNATNTWIRDLEVPCPKKADYTMTMIIVGDECVFYVDDREMVRQKTTIDAIPGLRLLVFKGSMPVAFDQIKLRKKE